MRVRRHIAAMLGFSLFGLAHLSADTISYSDFSSTVGLVFNGSPAASVVSDALQLTTAGVGHDATSVWDSTEQDVGSGFTTTFTYQVISPGADGFAFVVQGSPYATSALGGYGGDQGYAGITNSLAIDFDTYTSMGSDIQSCGTSANGSPEGMICTLQHFNNPTIYDGATHTATITYTPGTDLLAVSIDGGRYGTDITLPSDIESYLGLTGGLAWEGFTAGTGGSTQTVDIQSWSESTGSPEPSTFLLLGVSGAALCLWPRRFRSRRATLRPRTL